jgi:hypothetical protein
MSPWLLYPGVAFCAFVVLACICRVNLMRYGVNKLGWIALYILYAPFAGGMLITLLTEPERVEWWECVGVAGLAVHVVLTRRHWAMGAPVYTDLQS